MSVDLTNPKKRQAPRLLARAARVAAHGFRERLLLTFTVAILLCFAFTMRARAAQVSLPPDLTSLEVQVFTSEESAMPQVENLAVRAIQLNPTDARAHYVLALVMIRKFRREPNDLYHLKQASDLAQQAIDLDPKSPVGYVATAHVFDAMSSQDRALRVLDEGEAKGIKPNWRFSFLRARLVSAEAGSAHVLNLLDRSLSDPHALRQVVVPHVIAILQSEHQARRLVQKIQEWNSKFPSVAFLMTEAIAYGEMGDHRSAVQKYEAILAQDPDNREALINCAVAYYQHLSRIPDALNRFEQVLARYKATMPAGLLAMIYAHMGSASLKARDHLEARRHFFRSLEVDPENVGILDLITRTLKAERAYVQLVDLLREVSVQFKGLGVYHALLGETLSEHLHKHDEAVNSFKNAIVLEPDRGDYYNGMGLAFYRSRKFPDALRLFSAATDIDPTDATARYNEACVLALMGRNDEALATLAEAVSIDPRLIYTARVDQDFEHLKKSPKFLDLLREPSSHAAQRVSH